MTFRRGSGLYLGLLGADSGVNVALESCRRDRPELFPGQSPVLEYIHRVGAHSKALEVMKVEFLDTCEPYVDVYALIRRCFDTMNGSGDVYMGQINTDQDFPSHHHTS